MSVRVVLAVLVALGAGSAASVPLFVDGPMVALDLPDLGPASAGHAAHGGPSASGHAGHATTAKAAPATGHAHGGPAAAGDASGETADPHAGHAPTAGGAPAGDDGYHGSAHSAAGSDPGMQRPHFPPASGKVPSSASGLKQVASTFIESDRDLREFASSGSGTVSDPYVIRRMAFDRELHLADTDACVVIAENYIPGQLTLNWNGQCVWVHHNNILDLRVNENVPRKGYGTGGLMEHNEIGIIGQLRHYDGEFRHNVVGPAPPDALFDMVLETVPYVFADDTRVANVDGFNQGLIHHNTFHGSVDLDFHGHHHGTGFFAPHSHYHGTSATRQAEHMHDHSDRWTSVAFTDNVILDNEGYGLRYEDEAHSGDDRRATSEDMDVLSEPHTHHTDIVLARNAITGGHIWVDVFNADDSLHQSRNPGTLTIAGNTVETHQRSDDGDGELCLVRFGTYYNAWTAIHVNFAKEVKARITDNTVSYVPLPPSSSATAPVMGLVRGIQEQCATTLWDDNERVLAAIRLADVSDSDLLVQGNRATGFQVGVLAASMDDEVHWRVVGNDFGGAQPVRFDDSVANRPSTG